ncbi:C40 family peptidase [Sphingomonadaceae bacterium]|nr:C40 family peptidase [Sphingomonadaceae bacterium]
MTGRQTADGLAIARSARSFIGVPFRLHGRDPRYGLDCVGLVSATLAKAGFPATAPTGYALRNCDISAALSFAAGAGLQETKPAERAGDIALTCPGPGQFHLIIHDREGAYIHAHAGLRKVVLMPGPVRDPVLLRWRFDRSTRAPKVRAA